VSTQQQTISYALEQLRRTPWPESAVDFGLDAAVDTFQVADIDLADEAAPLSLKSDRWTCRLRSDSLQCILLGNNPVLIHAIDADLAVPLLAHWALRHREMLLSLVHHLKVRCDARLVLPNDLPGPPRRTYKGVRVEWIEPKYPAGHWRILPHVLGLQKQRPIVLDAVAAVDLAAALAGRPTDDRPVAIVDLDRAQPLVFKLASRADRLGDLLKFDEQTRWIAGPRWRRREASPEQTIGDGELVFFADRDSPERQSPCIRCGWCEYICPARCSPAEFLRAQRDHDLSRAHAAGLDSCIDCGLCTSVCPSNLPLYQFIDRLRTGKAETP
jgi:formate hydrogenlyase subunit 6/NADH:ubiquinone oxidoreductase subunit I